MTDNKYRTDQDIPALQPSDSIKLGSMVRCPQCNEEVLKASLKCPYCGHQRKIKREQ